MHGVPAALSAALSQRYQIKRELGAGGMATVYLARDLKLDRDVALKVLRDDVAAAVGVDRFLAEIKTTARLKHPHILPLFDSGSADGALFYVMPFMEGESLRERIRRTGPLPIAEAVRILRQVGDALSYAHARGIVHRDVKTDNVMIADGHAFLADFGIARAVAAHDPGATVTGSGAGVGTPAYMSPEQIVGGTVDQRTDIYALGALAYEMLTGAPPFRGTPQEVATAHLTRVPEMVGRNRADTPQPLGDLIMRCLEKAPESRPERVDDVLRLLEHCESTGGASRASRVRTGRVTATAGAITIVVAIAAGWFVLRDRTGAPVWSIGRLTHLTTDPGLELDPAISPDGRSIAYVAGYPGQMRIYVRELAGGRAVPLTETGSNDSERWPQWSPDGTRIVFQAGRASLVSHSSLSAGMGALYLATPLSGSARRLPLSFPGGSAASPAWSPDGRRIAFGGGDALYATTVDEERTPQQLATGSELHSPSWSPDGSLIAYVSRSSLFTFGAESLGNVGTSTLMVLNVAAGRSTAVSSGNSLDTNPVWMPDSRTLLFVSSRGGGRDVYTVRISGDGRPEHEPERLTSGVSAHGISVARDGHLLLYSSYAPSANIWSVRIPENGTLSVADAQQVTFGNEKIEKLTVSADRQWLAYDSDINGPADVWKLPLTGGRPAQVTRGPNHKFVNDWSPDGRELVYHTLQGGERDLFIVSADGAHTERVTSTSGDEQHAGWSPDGNSIVFDFTPPVGDRSQAYVVTRPRRGAEWSAPRRITQHGSTDPKWAPDGRLIAFCVDGQLRVIAPDGSGERVLVDARSSDVPDPEYPVWSRDGRTIYYKAYDAERHSTIWAVPASGGSARLLIRFDVPSRRSMRREFATDGQRFYFTVARDESDLWSAELVQK